MGYNLLLVKTNETYNNWCIKPLAKTIGELNPWIRPNGTTVTNNYDKDSTLGVYRNYTYSNYPSTSILLPEESQQTSTKYNIWNNVNIDFKDMINFEIDLPAKLTDESGQVLPYTKDYLTSFNYLIVTEVQTNYKWIVSTSKIHSRWFIESISFNSSTSIHLVLRRDVIADFYTKLIEAPVFIERGPLDTSDNLIFQSEGNQYNQIKTDEIALNQDNDNTWYVAYLASNRDPVDEDDNHNGIVAEFNGAYDTSIYNARKLTDIPVIAKYFNYSDINNPSSLMTGSGRIIMGDDDSNNAIVINAVPKLVSSNSYFLGFWDKQEASYEYTRDDFALIETVGLASDGYNGGPVIADGLSFQWCARRNNTTANAVMNSYLRTIDTDTFKENMYKYFINNTDFITDEVFTNDLSRWDNKIIHTTQTDKYYRVNVTGYQGSLTYIEVLNKIKTKWQNNSWNDLPFWRRLISLDNDEAKYLREAFADILPKITTDLNEWCEDNGYNPMWWNGSNDAAYTNYIGSPAETTPQALFNQITTATSAGQTSTDKLIWRLINSGLDYQVATTGLTITLTEITNPNPETTLHIQIPDRYSSAHFPLAPKMYTYDAPYDVLFLPAKGHYKYNGVTYEVDELGMYGLACDIATKGGQNVYDIQKLPYYWDETEIFNNTTNISNSDDVVPIKDGNNNIVGYGVFAKFASFKGTINKAIYNITGLTGNQLKVKSETEFYRVVSPNYQGVFEFTPAKNGGVSYWEYNCTYKPYQPYIHINPNFGRLYGQDFNDNRGLICSGDFSMPIVNNAWTNFMLNNKNYETQFNREIQHMEVGNDIARTRDIVSAITAPVKGAAAGAIAGNSLGGPVGAAIGAGVGGIAGLGAGIADYQLNEKERKENLSYAKDIHKLQTETIKAIPNSLGRTSAFDINTKDWPFVEVYKCTAQEKSALESYLKWYSMTVGVEGIISEYLEDEPRYFKGYLINTNDLSRWTNYQSSAWSTELLGPNVAREINNQLAKGIYLRQES